MYYQIDHAHVLHSRIDPKSKLLIEPSPFALFVHTNFEGQFRFCDYYTWSRRYTVEYDEENVYLYDLRETSTIYSLLWKIALLH